MFACSHECKAGHVASTLYTAVPAWGRQLGTPVHGWVRGHLTSSPGVALFWLWHRQTALPSFYGRPDFQNAAIAIVVVMCRLRGKRVRYGHRSVPLPLPLAHQRDGLKISISIPMLSRFRYLWSVAFGQA